MSSVAVLTGAAGGMGLATARRLAGRGPLVLADLFAEPLEALAQELRAGGAEVETQVCDVADPGSVRELVQGARSRGPIGRVAHLAGISWQGGDWESVIRVDLLGTAYVARELLEVAEPGTVLVCIASIAGHRRRNDEAMSAILAEPLVPDFLDRIRPLVDAPGISPRACYEAAKLGVLILVRRQARAFGETGARIVSISPGVIDTPMAATAIQARPVVREGAERSPVGRLGRPEEIAAAVDFLSSPDASFITGTDLLVDGGITVDLRPEPAPARAL